MTTSVREYVVPVLVSVAAGLGAVGTSYAVSGYTPEFVVSPVANGLARVMPGEIIAFMITNFGDLGKQINLLTGIGLTVGLFALIAALGLAVGRRLGTAAFAIVLTAGGAWLAGALLTGAAILSLGAGLGAGLVVGCTELAGRDLGLGVTDVEPDRRRLLAGGATAAGLGALGLGSGALRGPSTTDANGGGRDNSTSAARIDAVDLNRRRTARSGETAGDGPTVTDDGTVQAADGEPPGEAPQQAQTGETDDGGDSSRQSGGSGDGMRSVEEYKQLARERQFDVDGIEPLVSERFYNVDINNVDPDIDRSDWTLSVTGAVENELELTFEDITSLFAENRMVTLRCVGDSLNGRKLDNAVWTGVEPDPLLDRARPESGCGCVMLRAEDGFYEEFPLEALRGGLLAFGMNGEVLPRAHGYPLRALVPGHWGEVNVKWLTEIEILEREAEGYWEKKGWHGTGPVNTVAKLWDEGIVRNDDGSVTLAGHAYAGTRGIDRVEVSIDGGNTWAEATLTEPLPGDDVWRQWRYDFRSTGSHEVVVRAVDGEGNFQEEAKSRSYPSGATGWVTKTMTA